MKQTQLAQGAWSKIKVLLSERIQKWMIGYVNWTAPGTSQSEVLLRGGCNT